VEKSINKVHSVAKAMYLLELLEKGPLSLKDLAQRSGWPKSTVHGLLNSMRESRMIEQAENDGRYRLGLRLFELGSKISSAWDITAIARPHMQHIAIQTGQSVYLTMLDRNEVLLMDYADNGSPLRISADKGSRFPAYCTAPGKAIMSNLSGYEVQSILNKGLFAYTPHTILSAQKMKEELFICKKQGFAVEDGEHRIGLRAVAAPIFDVSGKPAWAISVIGMFRRISDDSFIVSQQAVVNAAAVISADLGYRPFVEI